MNSDKKVYGFDSFSGFPSYSQQDNFENFLDHCFNEKIRKRHNILLKLRSAIHGKTVGPESISSSLDFSSGIRQILDEKISLLGLDNIILVEGAFEDTVEPFLEQYEGSILAASLDCDLAEGYSTVLPQIWPHMVSGGYVHLDEYYSIKFPGARLAVDAFCSQHGACVTEVGGRAREFPRFALIKEMS